MSVEKERREMRVGNEGRGSIPGISTRDQYRAELIATRGSPSRLVLAEGLGPDRDWLIRLLATLLGRSSTGSKGERKKKNRKRKEASESVSPGRRDNAAGSGEALFPLQGRVEDIGDTSGRGESAACEIPATRVFRIEITFLERRHASSASGG
jgi:hypothetical protein